MLKYKFFTLWSFVNNFDKKVLRNILFTKRLRFSKKFITQVSQEITRKILSVREFADKKAFCLYLPINNEVDTRDIIDDLLQKKANIFVPAFSKKYDDYSFAKFTSWQDLEEGPKGILQPRIIKSVDSSLIEVAILPGLAFSKSGVRLGYGKGVFDKLLSKSKALRIGLAYDFQIVDEIPQEKHDLNMNLVVTEEKVYRMKKNDKICGQDFIYCRIV